MTPYSVTTDYRCAWFDKDREKPSEVASAVLQTVRDIEQRQTSIFEGNRRHARVYAGYLPSSMTWGATGAQRTPFSATRGIVRSICDTATALISRFRPSSTYVTDAANWEIQQQAEDMNHFMRGAFHRAGLYDVAPEAFHDSTIFGTGGWKLVPRGRGDDWYVATERFLIDDLVVDEDECRGHRTPECTYHRMICSRDAVIRKFAAEDPATARAIASDSEKRTWPSREVPKDKVVLVEAIRVDPDGSNHRRVLCTESAVLRDEVWPYDWHPYVFLWWVPPISGFYGDGIAYRQFGRQERITYMYRWATKVHDLFGRPTAWVDPMGGPPVMQMSNEIGAIIMARRPPVFQTQQMMQPEWYSWLDRLERGGFDDEGISQASAANTLPPGLESAPAQREYSFKESNRFAPVSQRWEAAVAVETAEKLTEMYRRRAEQTGKGKLKMRWAAKNVLHRVSWPDLDRNAYEIRAEASALEALSPASRVQAAIELSQTGWLMPGEGRALLGHPDLEESDKLNAAPFKYAKMILADLLDGKNVEVDEQADLEVLDEVVRKGRLWAKTRGAPTAAIDNCSDFLDRLDMVVQEANAAMMAAQAPMQPGPTGPAAGPGQAGSLGPLSPEAAGGAPLPLPG